MLDNNYEERKLELPDIIDENVEGVIGEPTVMTRAELIGSCFTKFWLNHLCYKVVL